LRVSFPTVDGPYVLHHGTRATNAKTVDFRDENGATLVTGNQAVGKGFLRKLANLTGMDTGNDVAYDIGEGDGAWRVTARPNSNPAVIDVERPVGTPLGQIRYLRRGFVLESGGQQVAVADSPPSSDFGDRRHYVVRDMHGNEIGTVDSARIQRDPPKNAADAAWRTYWEVEMFLMWDRLGASIPTSGRIQHVQLAPTVREPIRTLVAALAVGILEGEGLEHRWPEK
jgi:hypothetical protein